MIQSDFKHQKMPVDLHAPVSAPTQAASLPFTNQQMQQSCYSGTCMQYPSDNNTSTIKQYPHPDLQGVFKNGQNLVRGQLPGLGQTCHVSPYYQCQLPQQILLQQSSLNWSQQQRQLYQLHEQPLVHLPPPPRPPPLQPSLAAKQVSGQMPDHHPSHVTPSQLTCRQLLTQQKPLQQQLHKPASRQRASRQALQQKTPHHQAPTAVLQQLSSDPKPLQHAVTPPSSLDPYAAAFEPSWSSKVSHGLLPANGKAPFSKEAAPCTLPDMSAVQATDISQSSQCTLPDMSAVQATDISQSSQNSSDADNLSGSSTQEPKQQLRTLDSTISTAEQLIRTNASEVDQTWLTADDVRLAEETVCIREQVELSQQQQPGPECKTTRRFQEVCLQILELTTEFAGNLRIDINPEADRQHATQMYVDVVAIARRTKDAQDHCNAHTTAKANARRHPTTC